MPLSPDDLTPELAHFLELAKRGAHPGASSGEKHAATISRALVAGVPGLDDQALYGLVQLIGLVERRPGTCRELLASSRPVADFVAA